MVIAIDLTALDDNFTGIERYALNMALAMIRLASLDPANLCQSSTQSSQNIYCDIEFDLIFKNRIFPAFEPYQNQKNIRMHILPGCSKLLFNQWHLPRCLNRLRADRFLFFAFPMPILLCKKHVYSTIHDMGCWDCPETMKTYMAWYFRISYRFAVRRAERIITISEFSKSRIRQILNVPDDKILIAYCGVSEEFQTASDTADEKFRYPPDAVSDKAQDAADEKCQPSMGAVNDKAQKVQDAAGKKLQKSSETVGANAGYARLREKYHLPDDYYLCLSTLEPRKNMILLLNAYLDLYKQGKIKTRLVLAGRKGWKIDELLTRAGVADKTDTADTSNSPVVVTGFIDDADLPSVYRMAKCFIFPSVYEGFGIPPLEAMAQGVPVISSDATSMPEILGDAPLYFKSGDAEDLKRAILEMEQLASGENTDGQGGHAGRSASGEMTEQTVSEESGRKPASDRSSLGAEGRTRSVMAAAGLRRSSMFRYENEAKKVYRSMGIGNGTSENRSNHSNCSNR